MTMGDRKKPRMQPGLSFCATGGFLASPAPLKFGRRGAVAAGRVVCRLSGLIRRGWVGPGLVDIMGEKDLNILLFLKPGCMSTMQRKRDGRKSAHLFLVCCAKSHLIRFVVVCAAGTLLIATVNGAVPIVIPAITALRY